ncbi:NYN domain-containing protein [Oceanicaulis alexandrii]|uniref:NYN domain-containing protein n=1 Tax=Oceanicaulis alexandrii TaxID=153233 RepID=UPI003BB0AB48
MEGTTYALNLKIKFSRMELLVDFVYVDNSNLYIEGRRVSAVNSGRADDINEAMNVGILDQGYTIDFGKLHSFVCGTDAREIKRAALFGSRPPPNDGIWRFAEKAGFELILADRNINNKEKKVDTAISTEMTRDAYTKADKSKDTFVLVAGDGDFVPTVEALKGDGFKVEVVFWGHASRELVGVASNFISLNDHLEHLRL